MKQVLPLLLLLLSSTAFSHDVKMAIFELSVKDHGYQLEVSLDKDDLMKSVVTAYPKLQSDADSLHWKQSIHDYLLKNFQLHLNTQCQELALTKISFEKDFVKISFSLSFDEKIDQVDVFNTCLIDYNPGHRNIFKAKLNDTTRTFNLNQARISTSFSYN